MPPLPTPTKNPFESLRSCLAHHVRDWSLHGKDAWIWGIILGWDGDEDGRTGAMNELIEVFHWEPEDVERLRRLRARFVEAKRLYRACEVG